MKNEELWRYGIEGVSGLTVDGEGDFGVREVDGALFWKGQQVVTKNVVSLKGWEFSFALIATLSTFASTVIAGLEWLK